MVTWININKGLPESRTLVWIHVTYDNCVYDNVTERISIGTYQDNYWNDMLDFPFADDYTVTHWAVLDWPKNDIGD